jgi:hypothetical protein
MFRIAVRTSAPLGQCFSSTIARLTNASRCDVSAHRYNGRKRARGA